MRVNQLSRELNISKSTLEEVLKVLGFEDNDLMPNTIVPDEFADIIRRLSHYNDVDLFNLVENTLMRRQSVTQFGQLFPYGAVRIDLDTPRDSGSGNKSIQTSYQYDDTDKSFWLEELLVQLPNDKSSRISISEFNGRYSSSLFSVLIGYNGAGKSTLLREVVEFFLDLNLRSQGIAVKSKSRVKQRVKIIGVRYHIDGKTCVVVRLNNSYLATVEGHARPLSYLRFPSIVACSFGAFDKFPVQTVNGSGLSRYDNSCYKYVGAHVNGSMISASAIAFRLLFSLSKNMNERQRDSICSILDFIGYDHKISLQYSCELKSKKQGNAIKSTLSQCVHEDREYSNCSSVQKNIKADQLYSFYSQTITSGEVNHLYRVNVDRFVEKSKDELHLIYKLKQYGLVNSVSVVFYKNGSEISTEEMSSGEFNMLSMVLSISASVNDTHTLVLIDEPEISQHPNWQMAFIDNLDRALNSIQCHLVIATHSHMLVSDLPMNRSSVTQLEKTDDGSLISTRVYEDTYGWSAEEVLLKVFKTATDRNRYFGERIANLLQKMADDEITKEDVAEELKQLQEISFHLSDVDPMKMVLNTIIETYQA